MIIVATNCDALKLNQVAGRLIGAACGQPFTTSAGRLDITISLGGYTMTYDERMTTEQLVLACDRSLYKAKYSGRDSIVIDECKPNPSERVS